MNRPQSSQLRVISLAGLAILLLGIGALFLPVIGPWPNGAIVGWLLLLAGLFELAAGVARSADDARRRATLTGGLTSLAGSLFLLNVQTSFFATNYIVIGWLLLKGAVLLSIADDAAGRARALLRFNGLAHILLGLILIIGLPVSALVVLMFGPTPEVVASFALVFAASFVVSGLVLLLEARARKTNEVH